MLAFWLSARSSEEKCHQTYQGLNWQVLGFFFSPSETGWLLRGSPDRLISMAAPISSRRRHSTFPRNPSSPPEEVSLPPTLGLPGPSPPLPSGAAPLLPVPSSPVPSPPRALGRRGGAVMRGRGAGGRGCWAWAEPWLTSRWPCGSGLWAKGAAGRGGMGNGEVPVAAGRLRGVIGCRWSRHRRRGGGPRCGVA